MLSLFVRSDCLMREVDTTTDYLESDTIDPTVTTSTATTSTTSNSTLASLNVSIDVSQLNIVCLTCLQTLPNLLDIGMVLSVSTHSASLHFPYHPPEREQSGIIVPRRPHATTYRTRSAAGTTVLSEHCC